MKHKYIAWENLRREEHWLEKVFQHHRSFPSDYFILFNMPIMGKDFNHLESIKFELIGCSKGIYGLEYIN